MKLKKLAVGFMAITFALTGAAWAAQDILITPTKDGSTPETDFACGDTIILNIDWDRGAGEGDVAGCAFTITYNADVLDAPALSADGLPTTPSDVQTYFPFMTGTDRTYRVGDTQVGKLALSGAAIGSNGGAIQRSNDEFPVPLFSVAFKVKADVPIGSYQFGVQPTVLNNPDAGWNNEASPVLVGAVPEGDPAFDDLSGGAFPVLLNTISKNAGFSIISCPEFIPGDITGDGNVDLNDVRYLLYFVRGYPGYEDPGPVGDINKDGNIDLNDVRFLLYHVRGYPGYEELP